jgi:dipeptidyl aminopeptidase/acylaminoacyl peptidase
MASLRSLLGTTSVTHFHGNNGEMTDTDAAASPFADLERYVRIPRLSGLALSADGDRLVTTVAELDSDGGRYISSLWSLDPVGDGPARRLTRSEKGEASPVFASDGSLLFVSERLRPGGKDDDPAGVWRLPPEGGEPWPVATHPGGISAVRAAKHSPVVVFAAKVAPGGRSTEDDESWRKNRTTRKVTAILHENLPIRQWDHERGPDEIHFFAGFLPDAGADPAAVAEVRDLTPDAGQALHEASPVLSADGRSVVTEWEVALAGGRVRLDVVHIDVATGARTVLASHPDGEWSYGSPAISSLDGRVVCLGESRATLQRPIVHAAFLVDRPGTEPRRLEVGEQLWPLEATWTADGRAVLLTGDLAGHRPVQRIDPDAGGCTPLTTEGAWSDLAPAPDGSIYALRSGIAQPPKPVRLTTDAASGAGDAAAVRELDAPGAVEVPGRLEEISATWEDGTRLRAWMVLPESASAETPAPLLLWIHGGPNGSWNDWSWRWNPWLMAARGWAVLLPDPALSTGYGTDFIRRGWGQWGGNPYTDLMAMTDTAETRADIDHTRTAAMGGSYGGYMANWIAGHTGRFSAIVSHASAWSLEQFRATTDFPAAWADEWGRPADRPEFYRQWSPDTYIAAIATPMLIIHGKNDYRCPVSESVRLWTDLVEHGVEAKYLSFPDENHWILRPGDATVWYDTIFAFLDHYVLGKPWERPTLL